MTPKKPNTKKVQSKDVVFLFSWIVFSFGNTLFFLNETVQDYLKPIGWHTWLESLNFEVYNFYFNAFSKDENRYMLAFVWSFPILFLAFNVFVFWDIHKRKIWRKEVLIKEKRPLLSSLFGLFFFGGVLVWGFLDTPLRQLLTDTPLSINGVREFLLLQGVLIIFIPMLFYWLLVFYSLFLQKHKN